MRERCERHIHAFFVFKKRESWAFSNAPWTSEQCLPTYEALKRQDIRLRAQHDIMKKERPVAVRKIIRGHESKEASNTMDESFFHRLLLPDAVFASWPEQGDNPVLGEQSPVPHRFATPEQVFSTPDESSGAQDLSLAPTNRHRQPFRERDTGRGRATDESSARDRLAARQEKCVWMLGSGKPSEPGGTLLLLEETGKEQYGSRHRAGAACPPRTTPGWQRQRLPE